MTGHHELLDSGAQTRGLVIDKHITGRSQAGLRILSYTVQVRVSFADRTINEFHSDRLYTVNVGHLGPGDLVPVRYDPRDRSRLVVDTNALAAARGVAGG